MARRALITGITGQDGSYLAEYLCSLDYEVHGIIRRSSTFNTHRIDHLYVDPHEGVTNLYLYYSDMTDLGSLLRLIKQIEPEEVYNLAAQSHVRVSFDMPIYTCDVVGLGTTRILEALRILDSDAKFYQASSSEMYGSSPPPQNEDTPFRPRSPYAIAKTYAYWMSVNYRESYGMPIYNGILFNHESPRRGETFVTRKITRGLANIVAGKQHALYLGNLTPKRDWGYAPEYVMAMYKIVQHPTPDDFVLGTGKCYSVEDFLEFCFGYLGMNWRDYVKTDPKYVRPAEVGALEADSSKAQRLLNWIPKITAPDLAQIMVDYDLAVLGLDLPGQGDALLQKNGFGWLKEPLKAGLIVG